MLPFLDDSRSAVEYHRTSRLLFWSIIAVAARHFQESPSLLTKLTPVLTELLWKALASNITSLAQIQALILHSCWQLPNARLVSDKSMVFANVALTCSMNLGLHMPGHDQEYREYTNEDVSSTTERRLQRTRTWVACNIQSRR